MQLNKEEEKIAQKLIDFWSDEQYISDDVATKLKSSLTVRKTNWRLLAYYAFIVAVCCIILSVIVLLADKPIRLFIEKLLSLSNFGISVLTFIISVVLFYISNHRIQKKPHTTLFNKSVLLVASFFSIIAISFFGKALSLGNNNIHYLFLFASILYMCIAIFFQYQFLWVIAIIMSILCYITFTYNYQNTNGYFLGMNMIIRNMPFVIILLLSSNLIAKQTYTKQFYEVHKKTVWIFLFFNMWLISIFGNTVFVDRWLNTSQLYMLPFAIVSIAFCIIAMFYALRRQNVYVANLALIFLIINLISRYFEYLWKPLHKSVFFLLLAIIFAVIGWKSEKWWNLNK